MRARLAAYVWERTTFGARLVRAGLLPLSWAFGAIVARRNARHDRRARQTVADAPGVPPAISIGNLTVGGTGKTPLAAWCVAELRERGGQPALVMRGVGDDEWRVHEMLNPGAPVIVSPDRVAGMARAADRGADCVVLDDAFQHRRAPRVVDVVLISADRWTGAVRLLPAGPFREPLSALRRADLVVITVKAVGEDRVEAVCEAVAAVVPGVPVVVVRLAPGALHRTEALADAASSASGNAASSDSLPLDGMAGRRIGVLSSIADPKAFEQQLRQCGATIAFHQQFPDHHAFTEGDVQSMAARTAATQAELVVCTLKDAVKLSPLWPRATVPLWYLSQTIDIVRGAEALSRACDRVLAARRTTVLSAGDAGSYPSA